ncbi:MAG: hypothetical protein AUH30_16460 [Candidatus Rokubacteria bacterium 13_1_40CM_68_15]|nr:MAG: hypothetical protein AUH30_16460 [Candidatus Rokubacteria bacterium 13_1_40CM_68_15]
MIPLSLAGVSRRDARPTTVLRLIAAFKIVKGLVLLAAGSGTLRLLRRDGAADLSAWADLLHIDPDDRHLGRLLEKVSALDERTLTRISVGMLVYAIVLLIEGTGLMLEKRWAEYVAVIVTASFIPLEIYEIVRHVTVTRMLVLVINVAIVVYLARRLTQGDERPGTKR